MAGNVIICWVAAAEQRKRRHFVPPRMNAKAPFARSPPSVVHFGTESRPAWNGRVRSVVSVVVEWPKSRSIITIGRDVDGEAVVYDHLAVNPFE